MLEDHVNKQFECAVLGLPGSGGGVAAIGLNDTIEAAKMGCIVMSMRNGGSFSLVQASPYENLQRLFDLAAESLQHPELKRANLFTVGWSLGALHGFMNGQSVARRVVAHWGGSGAFFVERRIISGSPRYGNAVYKLIVGDIQFPALFTNGEKDNNPATSLKEAQESLDKVEQEHYRYGAIAPQFDQTHISPTWLGKTNPHNAPELGWLCETQDFITGNHGLPTKHSVRTYLF